MRERRALDRLRERGFEVVKAGELRSLLRELFVLTRAVIIHPDDTDDTAERLRLIDSLNKRESETVFELELDKLITLSWNPHPYCWKRLGGSSEVPEHDYVTYLEPTRDPTMKRRAPLTPQNSHWTGGLLTLDCLLYFLQHPLPAFRARALILVGVRSRRNKESCVRHYRLLIAAQEIVRALGLVFCLLTTTVVEPTGVPVQPNLRPWPAFVADYRGSPTAKFPMRAFWSFLCEPGAFERLFSCSLLVFDTLYDEASFLADGSEGEHNCGADADAVMKRAGSHIEALLVRSPSLGAIEEAVRTFCDISDEIK